jgi:predicted negative regulator of RcsB-dependent stress response
LSKRERISKELKGPDAFVSTSDMILTWMEKHSRSIGTVCALALIVAVGFTVNSWWNRHQETKAAEALYAPEEQLKKAEEKIRDERAEKMKDLANPAAKGKAAAKPEASRPVDFQADYAPAVDKIRTQIKAHADTRAALVSALNLASFLIQQKQYSLALEILNMAKFNPGSGDLLGGFRLMHVGVAELENGKADEALKAYDQVLKSPSLNYFHSEALLKSGVAYEVKGDVARARETYEKLSREYPNTEASTTGQQYKRLLDLKAPQKSAEGNS